MMGPAFSQDAHTHSNPETAAEPEMGDYGYGHGDLHAYGTIDRLMQSFGHACCDGGEGGECRKTEVRYTGERWEAYLNGTWCPLSITPHFDVPLPPDTQAVVCADYRIRSDGCSATYCAATILGTPSM